MSTILLRFRRASPLTAIIAKPHPKTHSSSAYSEPRFASSSTPGWEGRQPNEHVNNRDDELDVQNSAVQAGKKERAEAEERSSATNEKDYGNQNEKAQKDHPEAPGPVLGMNDERGPKGHSK